MNVFVAGPSWMGLWTETAVDALRGLGHHVGVFYHNRRTLLDHLTNRLRSVPGLTSAMPAWHEIAASRLMRRMRVAPDGGWHVLLSIQGRFDADHLAEIRRQHPSMRVLYWIGDPVPADEWPIVDHANMVDHFLIFSGGIAEQFRARGIEHVSYFPFGISPRLHTVRAITEQDRQRYSCDVSFVGTYSPHREQLLRHLNQALSRPVRIWGRSWRHAKGLRSGGRLTMQQALRVHACSRVALNVHAPRTDGGLNIRFYEIPAAGGFQITDYQSAIRRSSVRDLVVSFQTPDELVDHVQHFLAHEDERADRAQSIREAMLQHETAERRFEDIFASLGLESPGRG